MKFSQIIILTTLTFNSFANRDDGLIALLAGTAASIGIAGIIYGVVKHKKLNKKELELKTLTEQIKNKQEQISNISTIENLSIKILNKYNVFQQFNKTNLSYEDIDSLLYLLDKNNYSYKTFGSDIEGDIKLASYSLSQLKTFKISKDYIEYFSKLESLDLNLTQELKFLGDLKLNLSQYQNHFSLIVLLNELLKKYSYELSNNAFNENIAKSYYTQFPFLSYKENLFKDIKDLTDLSSKIEDKNFYHLKTAEMVINKLSSLLNWLIASPIYIQDVQDKTRVDQIKLKLVKAEREKLNEENRKSSLALENKKEKNKQISMQLEIERHRSNKIIDEAIHENDLKWRRREKELQDRESDLLRQLKAVQNETISLKDMINQLKHQLSSNKNTERELSAKLRDAKEEINSLKHKLSQAQSHNNYGRELQAAKDEVYSLNQKINKLNKDNNIYVQDIKVLKAELAKTSDLVKKLRDALFEAHHGSPSAPRFDE